MMNSKLNFSLLLVCTFFYSNNANFISGNFDVDSSGNGLSKEDQIRYLRLYGGVSAGIIILGIALATIWLFVKYRRMRHTFSRLSKGSSGSTTSLEEVHVEIPLVSLHYPPPASLTYGTFEDEVRAKWSRPSSNFPLSADIPRFVKVIDIYLQGKRVWPDPTLMNESKGEQIYSLLYNISTLINDHSSSNSLVNLYWNYLPRLEENANTTISTNNNPSLTLCKEREDLEKEEDKIDVSKRIDQVIKETIQSDCKLIRLLKACNQSILAPAVVRLKYFIGNEAPYQDKSGTWRISIYIWRDNVRVKHTRWEKATQPNSFQFKWEFELIFNSDVSELISIDLYISEFIFGTGDKDDIKKQTLKMKCEQACFSLSPPRNIWEMTL